MTARRTFTVVAGLVVIDTRLASYFFAQAPGRHMLRDVEFASHLTNIDRYLTICQPKLTNRSLPTSARQPGRRPPSSVTVDLAITSRGLSGVNVTRSAPRRPGQSELENDAASGLTPTKAWTWTSRTWAQAACQQDRLHRDRQSFPSR